MTKENAKLLVITDSDDSAIVLGIILRGTPYFERSFELNLGQYRRAEKEDIIAQHLMRNEYDAVLVPGPLGATAAIRAQHLGPVIGYSAMVQNRTLYDAVINLLGTNFSNPGKVLTDSLEGCL